MVPTNGTFINTIAVTDAFVRGGEVLRCGGTALRLEVQPHAQGAAPYDATRFGRLLGESAPMRRLFPLCERLAAVRIPVLIEGETGTGKETLAESLHDESGAPGPFIAFDGSGVAPSSMEAALFGDAQADLDASGPAASALDQAQGGTLFIDEVAELPAPLQAKLLRALERGEIRRAGGAVVRVNVRLICATRRDLDREVAMGRFRDDLLRVLSAARIELPPLRERRGDVALLARHFAERFGAGPDALSEEALAQLEGYAWPGNVRELQSAVARRVAMGEVALGQEGALAAPREQDDGAGAVEQMVLEGVPFAIARQRVVDAFERRYVAKVLEVHGGSVAKASVASGLARRYFQIIKARSRPAPG